MFHFFSFFLSELTIGKTKGVSPMLKELKKRSDPNTYIDFVKFLESLQLESLLPRMEVDMSLYITNAAKLEQMYPYLPQEEGMVAEVVYSGLKHAVSEEEEARAVRDTCKHLNIPPVFTLCISVCCMAYEHPLILSSNSPFASWMEHPEGLPSHQVPQC